MINRSRYHPLRLEAIKNAHSSWEIFASKWHYNKLKQTCFSQGQLPFKTLIKVTLWWTCQYPVQSVQKEWTVIILQANILWFQETEMSCHPMKVLPNWFTTIKDWSNIIYKMHTLPDSYGHAKATKCACPIPTLLFPMLCILMSKKDIELYTTINYYYLKHLLAHHSDLFFI